MEAKDTGGPISINLIPHGFALVSAEDFPVVSQHKWYLGSNGYAYKAGSRKKGVPCLLHRIVMSAQKGEHVHHVNKNKLDCTRANLERISPSEHQAHHKHTLIQRNKSLLIHSEVGVCKFCKTEYTKNPDHRGRQKYCSQVCAKSDLNNVRRENTANANK